MPQPKKKNASKKAARQQKKRSKKKRSQKRSQEASLFGFLKNMILLPFLGIGHLTRNFRPWVKWPFRIFASCAFIGFSLSVFSIIFYYILARTYDLKEVTTMPARTEILDRHGQILKNTQGREKT